MTDYQNRVPAQYKVMLLIWTWIIVASRMVTFKFTVTTLACFHKFTKCDFDEGAMRTLDFGYAIGQST
jgi:hypothetical protein